MYHAHDFGVCGIAVHVSRAVAHDPYSRVRTCLLQPHGAPHSPARLQRASVPQDQRVARAFRSLATRPSLTYFIVSLLPHPHIPSPHRSRIRPTPVTSPGTYNPLLPSLFEPLGASIRANPLRRRAWERPVPSRRNLNQPRMPRRASGGRSFEGAPALAVGARSFARSRKARAHELGQRPARPRGNAGQRRRLRTKPRFDRQSVPSGRVHIWPWARGRAARMRRPWLHHELARSRLWLDRGPSEAISWDPGVQSARC